MKKIFSLMLLGLFCLCTHAVNEARLYTSVPRVVETKGRSTTMMEVDVYLTNNVPVNTITFKAKLPEGVTVEKAELSNRVVNPYLNARTNVLSNSKEYAWSYVAMAYTDTEDHPLSITGNSGRIMTITLKVDNLLLKAGNYNIEFYGLSVGGPTMGQSIKSPTTTVPFTVVSRLGDANLSKEVDVNDVPVAAEMLLGKKEYKAEANVQYTDNVMTIGDITALIDLLKK